MHADLVSLSSLPALRLYELELHFGANFLTHWIVATGLWKIPVQNIRCQSEKLNFMAQDITNQDNEKLLG